MERLYIHLAVTAIIGFGGLVGALVLARAGYYSDVMIVVFFAGAVGAVVNNYFRIAKLSLVRQNVADQLANPMIVIQLYVSMLLSGILAFAAYGLFLSGLVQGALFPKFTHADQDYTGISGLLSSMSPDKNIDTAKAIVWAFIAGFCEKMIPNITDNLVAKAQSRT